MLLRLLFVLALMPALVLDAQDRPMRIGLLHQRTVKQVMVMSAKGPCTIYADGVRKGELLTSDGLRLDMVGGRLSAKSLSMSFSAQRIDVVPRQADGGFRLRALDAKVPERVYRGSLELQVQNGGLRLVNTVLLEEYTKGVVQAEAGNGHHAEYYKLQSVSCRTYALTNQRKHKADGFELCDGVHCQVYHGRNTAESIGQAVDATHGLVLVDADIRLIHATFHSNCGGETVNAEDLWSKSEPYLRATTDTFCLNAPQANWEKTLARQEWLGYLERRYGIVAAGNEQLEAVLNYEPQCRDLYLGNTWPLVPLKHVREDLKLRSTFFSVHSDGDRIVLRGRGFGHGVGLCQEGAMRMAQAGFSYMDILHHYYMDVHLVDLTTLAFFREEAPVSGPAEGPHAR